MNGYYGLPAGKVEVGEGFLPAAIREAKEEVGITIFPAGIKHAVTLWRLAEDTGLEWCDVAFDVSSWKGEPYNAEPMSIARLLGSVCANCPTMLSQASGVC